MKSKYDPILKVMPKTKYRDEVLFKVAGDEFLEVAHGREKAEMSLTEKLTNLFSVLVVDEKVKNRSFPGLIETIPGPGISLYKFDPLKTSMAQLIEQISIVESEVESIEETELETRLVRLPLVFSERGVREAIEKYVREVKPHAPNCKNGSNLEYVASYNGITVEELKRKVLKTEWFLMLCFYPGVVLCFPLDPTCTLKAPKYDPARTWTAAGTVDLADFTTSIFGVESAGGYQLIARTAPVFQPSQKHPQFKETPNLFRTTDIVKYYEVSEKELQKIYSTVDEGGGWKYDIAERKFSLKEWLKFCEQLKGETEEFRKKQEYGRKVTPLP